MRLVVAVVVIAVVVCALVVGTARVLVRHQRSKPTPAVVPDQSADVVPLADRWTDLDEQQLRRYLDAR